MTTNDVTQIAQLVLWERQARVRGLADQLGDCFHPDATVTTSWVQGSAQAFVAGARARSAGSSGPIVNRVGAPVVRHAGQRAVVELPSTTTRWIPVNGVESVLVSFMRLLYRAESREGVWRIDSLTAINEADTLESAVPGADLHVDPGALGGLRHSYRFLAYTRSLEGETVSPDLYGIDRPDAVDSLYDEAFTWMGAQRADEESRA
ncbi:nuclear transport factor 2 family protein [Amycolatopsis sp. H20-H5]|uniref:nuclear transport factor 2 family protein n=1 Tax=Amycolatopsis sp. H20-H5 TaxID=3046309 RepID=UPI002DB6D710|nr:nuclear transport factor 2 family protein [Amycolatopsis sp. H20-H5]MEC3981017.1 nuclear transport factor 2 family protein [Amycolatopsis sp. H20-H5]